MNDGADLTKHFARLALLEAKHHNSNGAGMPLAIAVQLTGWPSCQERDEKEASLNQQGRNPRPLNEMVLLTGFPTPKAEDAESSGARLTRGKSDTLTAVAGLAGWTTPGSEEGSGNPRPSRKATGRTTDYLANQVGLVDLAGYPTPNAMEGGATSRSGNRIGEPLMGGIIRGLASMLSHAPTAKPGHFSSTRR